MHKKQLPMESNQRPPIRLASFFLFIHLTLGNKSLSKMYNKHNLMQAFRESHLFSLVRRSELNHTDMDL